MKKKTSIQMRRMQQFWQLQTWISLLEPAHVWMACTPRTLNTPEPMMVVVAPMPEVCRASDSFSASPQHLEPLLLRPAVSESVPREDDAYEYNGYFVTYISLRDTLEDWS